MHTRCTYVCFFWSLEFTITVGHTPFKTSIPGKDEFHALNELGNMVKVRVYKLSHLDTVAERVMGSDSEDCRGFISLPRNGAVLKFGKNRASRRSHFLFLACPCVPVVVGVVVKINDLTTQD